MPSLEGVASSRRLETYLRDGSEYLLKNFIRHRLAEIYPRYLSRESSCEGCDTDVLVSRFRSMRHGVIVCQSVLGVVCFDVSQ